MITMTAQYQLSAAGQREALRQGKSGARLRTIIGEVDPSVLDLPFVEVDKNGNVTLDGVHHVDDLDAPPDDVQAVIDAALARIERLLQKRIAAYLEWAEKTLAEDTVYSAPFGPEDLKEAMALPRFAEAWAARNARSDKLRAEADAKAAGLMAAAAAKMAEREARLKHEHEFVRLWLLEHGTVDQQERFEAGVLPEGEYLDPMAGEAFANLTDLPAFIRIADEEVIKACDGRHYAKSPEYSVTQADTVSATAWAVRAKILAAYPDAEIKFLLHRGTLDRVGDKAGTVERLGIQARVRFGPLTLTREFSAI